MYIEKIDPKELGKVFGPGKVSEKKVIKKKKKTKAPLIISKKHGLDAEEEVQKWLSTEPGFIEGFTEDVYGKPSSLYKYQIKYLNDTRYFIHIDKSRQTGFSYIYAARGIARSHLSRYHTSIFISITQEEANEKVVYAKGLYESLPLAVQKKLVVDNKHSLEFEDHAGRKKSRTRIISHAQREPRGKGGNVDVYLDEAAHYTWGQQIYIAAVPIITRGSGTLTIGSTPLGKKGIHYDITSETAYRKIYSFHRIFWWNCIVFVKKGAFKKAQKEAPVMSTEERVVSFGSEKLIAIFISMNIDQFCQEYEILHVDESVSFFPIDLINSCVYEIVVDDIFLEDDEHAEDAVQFPIMEKYGDVDFKLYDTLEDILSAMRKDKIRGKLIAGYDVGRKKHAAEFAIIEELGEEYGTLQIVRFLKTFRRVKYRKQKVFLERALSFFPNMKMRIDSGGSGSNLAEDLEDFSWRVDGIDFTNPWKEEICSDIRIRLEDQTLAIPGRKDVKNQIHSIKRKVTESGNFIFDAEKNSQHHGDIFWAIAMASSLGSKPYKRELVIPNIQSDPIAIAPRVIPIEQARNFGKIVRQVPKDIVDINHLKRPESITSIHKIIGG